MILCKNNGIKTGFHFALLHSWMCWKALNDLLVFGDENAWLKLFSYLTLTTVPCVAYFYLQSHCKNSEVCKRERLDVYDKNSPYEKLLEKSGKNYMHTSRLRALYIKGYKTMKQLNPVFMDNIVSFKSRVNLSCSQRDPHDLSNHGPNQTITLWYFHPRSLEASDMEWIPEWNEVCTIYTQFQDDKSWTRAITT